VVQTEDCKSRIIGGISTSQLIQEINNMAAKYYHTTYWRMQNEKCMQQFHISNVPLSLSYAVYMTLCTKENKHL
jgi:hypothetical protein